jgi:hypothetical protein
LGTHRCIAGGEGIWLYFRSSSGLISRTNSKVTSPEVYATQKALGRDVWVNNAEREREREREGYRNVIKLEYWRNLGSTAVQIKAKTRFTERLYGSRIHSWLYMAQHPVPMSLRPLVLLVPKILFSSILSFSVSGLVAWRPQPPLIVHKPKNVNDIS